LTAPPIISWIDALGLGLVAVCTLLGIVRGLWWQVVRLVGVILAVGIARALSPRFVPEVEARLPSLSHELAFGIAWFALFVAALVVASLLGTLGKRSLEALQLGPLDRLGGALAGALTGLLVHAAVLVGLVTFASPEWSQATLDRTRSQALIGSLAGRMNLLVDAHAAERLEPWLGERDAGEHEGEQASERVR
jgi:uncharacterized membrane protein required for colicin V production